MKNPHAVALGRLGGAKGGAARARALSATRRREIARIAGTARAAALSASERRALAQRAADARWARSRTITTGSDAPIEVRRLLKSYDAAALRWSEPNDRYAIVRAILLRGDERSRRWLHGVLRRDQLRELARQYAGAGSSEPERARLRSELGLTVDDIPMRPYLGFRWRSNT